MSRSTGKQHLGHDEGTLNLILLVARCRCRVGGLGLLWNPSYGHARTHLIQTVVVLIIYSKKSCQPYLQQKKKKKNDAFSNI